MDGTRNPLWDLAETTGRKRLPFNAVIELTYRCNLRCRHCYCVPLEEPEADTDAIRNLLDELAAAGVLVLTLTGGEIRTRHDLFEILDATAERSFAIGLFTNLVGWTEVDLSRLLSFPVYIVETSLYGADEATHDAFTGVKGSHRATLASIHHLTRLGMPVLIKTMWTRWNWRQYPAILKLVRELRAACPDDAPERVQFQGSKVISVRRDGGGEAGDCRLSDGELTEFLRMMLRDAQDATSLLDRFCEASRIGDPLPRPCGAGLSSIRIDPRGVAYPCIDIEEPAGDLRETPFLEIWKNSPLLEELRERGMASPECTACEIKGFCARCPGDALKEAGSLYAPSPEACRIARIRKQVLEEMSGERK